MKPEEVYAKLGDLPHMKLVQGRKLWEHLCEHQVERCLELGFFHGTSSAYIAAALDELGRGSLDCVDRLTSDRLKCTRRNQPGALSEVRRSEQARPERALCTRRNRTESEPSVTDLRLPRVHPPLSLQTISRLVWRRRARRAGCW